jgi:carboxypeptidase family protein
MKKHWALVLPLLVIGCADPEVKTPEDKDGDGIADGVREPDLVTVVAPATPKGTVSGQVLDTRMAPLEGVSVRLTIGSATADKPFTTTTDAAGNFLLTGVPAGSQVLVTVSKQGYATLRASATVPSSAGNVPINDGNANVGVIALAETTSTVRFTLLTTSGAPASGAQAYLEARPAGTIAINGSSATATSSVVVSAKADALGVVTFNNVPSPAELARIGGVGPAAGGYRLWVDPVDSNGDGITDIAGYSGTFDAEGLMVSGGTRVLRLTEPRTDGGSGPAAAFQLVATNVPSLNYVNLPTGDAGKAAMELQKRPLRNLVTPGQPIYLGFSHPVVKDSVLAIVTDELGRDRYDVTVTASASGDVYAITPSAAQIREGQEHNVILRATSAYDGTVKTWKGYFVSGDPRTPKPVQVASAVIKDGTSGTAGTLEPGECVVVTLSQVVIPTATTPDAYVVTDVTSPAFKPLTAAPPANNTCLAEGPPKFPIDTTNFNEATSRFVFQYGSASSSLPAINPTTTTAKVRFDFARFQTAEPSAYWETAWGGPVALAAPIETTLSR